MKFGYLIGLMVALHSASVFAEAPTPKTKVIPAPQSHPSVVGPESGASGNAASSHEDWKGPSRSNELSVGFSTGYGSVENLGGISVRVNGAKKILNRGFVPDINNQVYIEADVGPVFRDGSDPFLYSVHARWDFQKDETWTFFALGGLAGHVVSIDGKAKIGFYPRLGVGAFFRITDLVAVRADVSHELITVGANFWF